MKTETKCRVAACAAGFALPRYADLPQMGLYLDQTVQYVNSYFRTFCGVELTSSMVSNYVKKGILSHRVRKKYARDQIASLMYIAVSKTVLSMENIDALFKMQRAHCSAGAAYDYFCDEVENCLPFIFGASSSIRDLDPDANDEKRLLRGIVRRLPEKERQLMVQRFGLFGARVHTQKQLADQMGISQSYISRLEKRILSKIRKEMLRECAKS